MRKILIAAIAALMALPLGGQNIGGQWWGLLDTGQGKLRIVFNIAADSTGLKATMDSPDQHAKGIRVLDISFVKDTLRIEMPGINLSYGAVYKDNALEGTFRQFGKSYLLGMTRQKIERPVGPALIRPQEPQPPYPYTVEEVSFAGADSIKLAGTLTMPEGGSKLPAVVLIAGSGPNDRNEDVYDHKPFLVIADHLTRNGFAVLRYDKRGIGESEGEYGKADLGDFASDARSAFNYLKARPEVDARHVGLVGHSEGGMIAPMVAAQNGDVKFIVLMAGVGIPGDSLIIRQSELLLKASGVAEEMIGSTTRMNRELTALAKTPQEDDNMLRSAVIVFVLDNYPEGNMADPSFKMIVDRLMKQLSSPWYVSFITADPARALEKVKCPVMAINGTLDLQVPPKENLEAIGKALKKARNKKVTIKEYPGLNHLFQPAKTGLPDEYQQIEQTIAPAVLDDITQWMKANK